MSGGDRKKKEKKHENAAMTAIEVPIRKLQKCHRGEYKMYML